MLVAICAAALAAQQPMPMSKWPKSKSWPAEPGEIHLKNIKQLTFGGQNAEAYLDAAGTKLIFQSSQPGYPDEQVFTMNLDGSDRKLVSTGKGRCTCSYFSPDGKHIYFSSTHATDAGPQAKTDMSKGYVWMVNPAYVLYRADLNGKNLKPVIKKPGYVAETTVAPNGQFMTFTGGWEGDLDIYRANLDGTGIKRLTDAVGYDGGPFISWDSKSIVYRRTAPFANQAEIDEYKALLKQNLVRPSKMDIWIMDANGNYKRQVTHLNAASFAPFLHPNGHTILFASNHTDPQGREFDIFAIEKDGTNLRQITFSAQFDGFPMFTRDGKKLVFASNRHGSVPGETNIFVADWVD